jgi:uncharacterized protein (TIGR02246 family)
MFSRFGMGLVALVIFGAEASAQGKLLEELLAQETKLIEAINKRDKATISTMLADEGLSITSRGKQTNQEILASLEKISFTDYKITGARALYLTPEVAILTYTFSWTGEEAGQAPATTHVYATSVWRKRDGKWRSVFYQETPMVLPRQPASETRSD